MKTADIKKAFLAHAHKLGLHNDNIRLKRLGLGENNLTYLVTAGGQKFVIRIGLKKELDRNFRREFRFLGKMPSGVAPTPLLLDTTKSVLPYVFSVLSYTEGKHRRRWTRRELGLFARAIAKVHLTERKAGYGDSGAKRRRDIVRMVDEQWWRKQFKAELAEPAIHACYERMVAELQADAKTLDSLPAFTLIHGDACVDNVIFHAGEARLIDWEWATYDDPAIDLAKCFFLGGDVPPWRIGLDEEQVRFLVREYQKVRPDRTLFRRTVLWSLVSNFGDMLYFHWKAKHYRKETKPRPKAHYQRMYERMLAYFTRRYTED